MKPKHYPRPELSEDENKALLDDLENLDANDIDELARGALEADIRAIQAGRLPYGDDDLVEVARRALKAGAKGILDGNPSPAFLSFVAQAINKALCDNGPSLDVAMGLRRTRGRKPKAPQDNDHVIWAFYGAMECAIPWLEKPGRGEVGFDELERRAMDAAYKAKHGKSQQEHRHAHFNEKSINDRLTEVKRLLHERGLYRLDERKGRAK